MNLRKQMLVMFLVMGLIVLVHCGDKKNNKNKLKTKQHPENKQILFGTDIESRETDPPNFVRLLIMRLIYGLAVQMGVEDRLAGVLNGVFVPPNADDDFDDGDGLGLGDIEDVGGDLFDF